MGKVGTGLSMSLDGFIAGPGDDVGHVCAWYFGGDTDYRMPSGGMTLTVSPASAERLRVAHRTTGAVVQGRRPFGIARGWGGRHPMDVPVFVVTHPVPPAWVNKGSPFTFVTDGNRVDPVAAGMPPDVPQDVRHVVTFAAEGGTTEMTVTEYGYTSDHPVEISKLGLEQCLDKMAAHFAES